MKYMILVHLLFAVLASWRIVELFTQDRITDKLRRRFPSYLWQCPRCMSVWAGAWSTLIFALGLRWPWVNFIGTWPFAIAWLYLLHLDLTVGRRWAYEGRKLTITLGPAGGYNTNSELSNDEMEAVVMDIQRQLMIMKQGAMLAPPPIPMAVPLQNGEIKAPPQPK